MAQKLKTSWLALAGSHTSAGRDTLPRNIRALSLLLGLAVVTALLLVATPGATAETAAPAASVLTNGGFESGTQGWTAKTASFSAAAPAQSGSAAAQLKTTKKTGRAQFYQSGIALEPNTNYVLTFWAKAPSGKDLDVSLYKQSSASTSYGLKNRSVNLTTSWKQFKIEFTTTGFNGAVSDGRLRFRMAKGLNIEYSIDEVSLSATGSTPPPSGNKEMLIFDWNKQVIQSHSGFAMEQPPMENGNWVTPVNYAGGTIHFRAHIRSIPENQSDMKLGWCVWQDGFTRENCKGYNVPGVPGTIVTWSITIKDMWKKNGVPIDWSEPRTRNGFVVRNNKGPVSSKAGMNWSGEDPADWYPMDLRYTAVVVAAGSTFSGWDNYIR